MALFLLLLSLVNINGEIIQKTEPDFKKLYAEADFVQIVDHFSAKDFESLALEEKLLLIECQARAARSKTAEENLKKLRQNQALNPQILALEGIIHLARGRIQAALDSSEQALQMAPGQLTPSITKVMAFLYLQRFSDAEKLYEKLQASHPDWKKSYFAYLLGMEVYTASRNSQKQRLLMRQQANRSKQKNKNQAKNLEDTAKLYPRKRNEEQFQTDMKSDTIAIPFIRPDAKSAKNMIELHLKGNTYTVLLDTGNSVGWVVHNRDLVDILKTKRGGRTFSEIGTEAVLMEGNSIYTRAVDFGAFQINHLIGLYVPKPRPDYYDANFNPAFIRDKVVTLDFKNQQLELKSKQQFEKDKTKIAARNSVYSPWLGYKYVFTLMLINEKDASVMLETGAEDISLRLDFAQEMSLVLNPKTRYLADGKAYPYHETWVKVLAGPFEFTRRRAEVWPFDRIYNRISGLSPDVIFGPRALRRYRLTFDPFAKQILLERNPQ